MKTNLKEEKSQLEEDILKLTTELEIKKAS